MCDGSYDRSGQVLEARNPWWVTMGDRGLTVVVMLIWWVSPPSRR